MSPLAIHAIRSNSQGYTIVCSRPAFTLPVTSLISTSRSYLPSFPLRATIFASCGYMLFVGITEKCLRRANSLGNLCSCRYHKSNMPRCIESQTFLRESRRPRNPLLRRLTYQSIRRWQNIDYFLHTQDRLPINSTVHRRVDE